MWWIFSQNFPEQREWVSILQASRITHKQSRNRGEQFKIVGVNKLKSKLEIKHNMEANELKFHKNIIKSPMLASKHQNRILLISKNKIEKVMNRVHTWKAYSQMEAHLTSSPVFMTPLGRCPGQDLFSPGYSPNSFSSSQTSPSQRALSPSRPLFLFFLFSFLSPTALLFLTQLVTIPTNAMATISCSGTCFM